MAASTNQSGVGVFKTAPYCASLSNSALTEYLLTRGGDARIVDLHALRRCPLWADFVAEVI